MNYFSGLAEDVLVSTSDLFLPTRLAEFNSTAQEEYWASLTLKHTQGIGVRTVAKLLKGFGGACEACHNLSQWPEFGVSAARAASYAKEIWRNPAKKEWQQAMRCPASILLWKSPDYPMRLREIVDAPAYLYFEGDSKLLQNPGLGIVGTRMPTKKGIMVAGSLGLGLAQAGITVISGMAMGIDRTAHAAAMDAIGSSIGVLGTGIDVVYPQCNADIFKKMRLSGLLVSEFAPGTAPLAAHFPIRNRIISGLSLGIIVVEAALRSGSLVTARLALEQNREVFAVPGDAFNEHSQGCQNLVRQGARAVFCSEDVLHDLAEILKLPATPDKVGGAHPARNPSAASQTEKSGRKRDNVRQNLMQQASFPLLGSNPAPLPGCSTNNAPPDSQADPDLSVPEQTVEPAEITQAAAAAGSLLGGDASAIILGCLQNSGPLLIDELSEKTGIAIADLTPALLGLEITGQITRLPGARYEAC